MAWNQGGRNMVMVHCPKCSRSYGAQNIEDEATFVCPSCPLAFAVNREGQVRILPEPVVLAVQLIPDGEEAHGRGEEQPGPGGEVAQDSVDHTHRTARRPKR